MSMVLLKALDGNRVEKSARLFTKPQERSTELSIEDADFIGLYWASSSSEPGVGWLDHNNPSLPRPISQNSPSVSYLDDEYRPLKSARHIARQ